MNVGEKGNYVIPDASLHRPGAGGTYVPTTALAIEILSPDDDTWEKLPFYASAASRSLRSSTRGSAG